VKNGWKMKLDESIERDDDNLDEDGIPEMGALSQILSDRYEADILFYNGGISGSASQKVIEMCRTRSRRKNVILMLVTPGGDADAAYRIARCLQEKYEKFILFVPGWCKSAGTLLAIGADELYMSDYGELGPLDVQLSVTDELWEYSSGLTVDAAVKSLQSTAFDMFEHIAMSIKARSGGRIKFTTASEISANIVSGLLAPVFEQIDPLKIGDNSRSMAVAQDYGDRLNYDSDNLVSEHSLVMLVQAYSSHSFVIDRKEASELFKRVFPASEELDLLAECCGKMGRYPIGSDRQVIEFLCEEPIITLKTDLGDENAPTPDNSELKSGQVAPAHAQGDHERSDGVAESAASIQAPVARKRSNDAAQKVAQGT
jgi:hypothetical protein